MTRRTTCRLRGPAAALAALCLSAIALGQEALLEDRVKAAFIYNFTKFISWPSTQFSSPQSPINLCVSGDRKMHALLSEAITGKTSQQRPLQSFYVNSAERLDQCHILYVSESGSIGDAWLAQAGDAAIVTIVSAADFSGNDGIIGFTRRGEKIGFIINNRSALEKHLVISSKLLALAERVER